MAGVAQVGVAPGRGHLGATHHGVAPVPGLPFPAGGVVGPAEGAVPGHRPAIVAAGVVLVAIIGAALSVKQREREYWSHTHMMSDAAAPGPILPFSHLPAQ